MGKACKSQPLYTTQPRGGPPSPSARAPSPWLSDQLAIALLPEAFHLLPRLLPFGRALAVRPLQQPEVAARVPAAHEDGEVPIRVHPPRHVVDLPRDVSEDHADARAVGRVPRCSVLHRGRVQGELPFIQLHQEAAAVALPLELQAAVLLPARAQRHERGDEVALGLEGPVAAPVRVPADTDLPRRSWDQDGLVEEDRVRPEH
mmetsp:Transcript_109255/g.319842  ORF Transcript_109255/g.319842 Transcript_109255/m.319842 type:complete len:203 (-) Transcript_109255:533-1141(-)